MIKATPHRVVLVTAPDTKIARRLAKGALKNRLVACANLIPKIESHYWWNGKIEHGSEVLILFKTSSGKLKALEKFIIENHPYDTPEFLVVPLHSGNKRYLQWLTDSVTPRS